MIADFLPRLGLAIAIILFGLCAYWLANQRLLAKARANIRALPAPLPSKPTIVYFTTPDCAPCKTVQRPALQKLRDQLGERLHVIEVDATQNPDIAKHWGVMSVPTTFLLDEKGAARFVNNGVARLEKLKEQVKAL